MRYMDYDKFKKDYETFEKWKTDDGWEALDKETPKNNKNWDLPNLSMYNQVDLKDGKRWLKIVADYDRSKDTPIEEAVDRVRSIREDIDRFVKEHYVGPVDNDGNFYDPSHKTTPTQRAIERVCDDVRDLLISKNKKYGNSALEPRRVFSKSDPIEQIKVRIDDKLSRIATSGTEGIDEDTLQDLIGYLVLLKVAMNHLESLED